MTVRRAWRLPLRHQACQGNEEKHAGDGLRALEGLVMRLQTCRRIFQAVVGAACQFFCLSRLENGAVGEPIPKEKDNMSLDNSNDYAWPSKGARLLRAQGDWNKAVSFADQEIARDVHIWDGYVRAGAALIEQCERLQER